MGDGCFVFDGRVSRIKDFFLSQFICLLATRLLPHQKPEKAERTNVLCNWPERLD